MYNIIFLLLYTLRHAYHRKFSFHPWLYSWPPVGKPRYRVISSELTRNFETEIWSRPLHKVQLWSLLWVTYIQAGKIWWMDDPEAFAAALHVTEKGTGEFKGAEAKNRIWLPSKKHTHTDKNWGFFLSLGVSWPLTICTSKDILPVFVSDEGKGKNW